VLAVGEVLDVPTSTRRRPSALPIDVARTVEEALTTVELDFVHVHEPFAPSTSSAALRHSRALNVGSFHAHSERLLSTLLARRFVESLFGRLDARTASTATTASLMARHFPGDYQLVPDGPAAADAFEAIYRDLAARRHVSENDPAIERRLSARALIDVDLHMHTDHSYDCATPVEVLLATARAHGLGAIAVTDHNEISGALAAHALSEQNGGRVHNGAASGHVKVVVGEEVKTAGQGEVIGLFISEKIPRGLTLAETIAEIKRQGGLVYVPHPFDRMHSVPDYEHLLPVIDQVDIIEVLNSRVAISAFNDEAERFAAKYRIPAGAGSDSHVPQGLGSARIRMRDFDGPAEFMQSLRSAEIVTRPSSLIYVQALKFLQTRARPAAAQRASRSRRVRRVRRAAEGRGRR
jgi:predicted metal-dependent phosphoesterase TrpH